MLALAMAGKLTKTFDRTELYLSSLVSGQVIEHRDWCFGQRQRSESVHFETAEVLARACAKLAPLLEEQIPTKRLSDLFASMLAQVEAQRRLFEETP